MVTRVLERRDGLRQEVAGTEPERVDRGLESRVRGQQQHRRCRPRERERVQLIDELQPRDAGHVDVAHDDGDFAARAHSGERLLRIAGRAANEARAGQHALEKIQRDRVVIEQKNFV